MSIDTPINDVTCIESSNIMCWYRIFQNAYIRFVHTYILSTTSNPDTMNEMMMRIECYINKVVLSFAQTHTHTSWNSSACTFTVLFIVLYRVVYLIVPEMWCSQIYWNDAGIMVLLYVVCCVYVLENVMACPTCHLVSSFNSWNVICIGWLFAKYSQEHTTKTYIFRQQNKFYHFLKFVQALKLSTTLSSNSIVSQQLGFICEYNFV